MRVTNSMLVSNFMNNMNTNLNKLSDIQSQQESGRKFAHISDDPVAVIYSRQARYKLEHLSHYQRNVGMAKNWLTETESGAMELDNVLASAYEACIDASTDIKNGKDLQNCAKYVGQLRDQILQTLNTTLGDKFIYGGYNTTGYNENGQAIPPFTVNAAGNLCYNGVDLTSDNAAALALVDELRKDTMSFDVALGSNFPVAVNGIDMVFYGKDPNTGANLNIYNLLSNMYNTLMDNSVDADGNRNVTAETVDNYISDLQLAQNHIMSITAELGGRANRLEILETRYGQDEINYTQMLSDAEDVDFAEVIMRYKMAESVYKAALSAGASIIQPTLMDFLR